jgi:hypothetical protein
VVEVLVGYEHVVDVFKVDMCRLEPPAYLIAAPCVDEQAEVTLFKDIAGVVAGLGHRVSRAEHGKAHRVSNRVSHPLWGLKASPWFDELAKGPNGAPERTIEAKGCACIRLSHFGYDSLSVTRPSPVVAGEKR